MEGPVIALDMATDLGLPDNICAGYQDQVNFQVTFTTINNFTPPVGSPMAAPELVLYIVTVQEGSFCIPQINTATKNIGIVTAKDILNAKVSHRIKYYDVARINGGTQGRGNFLDTIEDIGSKINNALEKSHVISKGLSVPNPYSEFTAPAAQFVSSLGYGAHHPQHHAGAVLDPSQSMGNFGGRHVSKKELAKRLMNI